MKLSGEQQRQIYTKSGHQINFSLIRDLLNLRIEPLTVKIAEEENIRKEREAQRLAKEAEEQRIRKEKEAEEQKIEKVQEEAELEKLKKYIEAYSNIDVYQIFSKIKCIIVEQLEVEPEQAALQANIMNDLGADELDIVELAIALEEKFNIELPEDSLAEIGVFFGSSCSSSYTISNAVSVGEILNLVLVCKKINS